ncbi:ARID/BRIGHT DNA binding domain [Ceratobasidium sp. AG-Ba]|nr:ARID/BRIGHT DNA binding domain [Ceratobasidium sp. AG-Ba]
MGDPLNQQFAQQALFRQLQASQLNNMNNPNAGVPPGPPALGSSIPSIPGGVQDPDQAKMWKAIGDQFRNRPNNGNPTQFLQNIVQMQGQGFRPGHHAMALASGPQANQPGLGQPNPTTQQQLLQQQQNMQRFGMNLAQQQQHLQQNNPALLSMMGLGANGMAQGNNNLIPGLLRNPNNMFDNSMNNQAMQRARSNLVQTSDPAAAANQHIRLPSDGHNASPLLTAPHEQNIGMQPGLNRSPQPGNPNHPPGLAQPPQSAAIIQKLDSMPLRELEMRVTHWREGLALAENRVRELIIAIQRPGAPPDVQTMLTRARQEYDHARFLFQKAQEILARKVNQQQQLQGQNSARMTPTNMGEPNRPGSRTGGGLPGPTPGMPGWQPQAGPSSTPQIPPQPSPRNASATPFQPIPSPQPNADQQGQQASPQFRPGGRQSAIPRDRNTFATFMRMWFMQTGRNVENVPKIGEKPLDLYQMYIEVEGLGGPEKVQATGLWHLVAMKMGYVTHDQNDPQLAQIAKILADAYSALLLPFDQFCVERMHMLSHGVTQQRHNQLRALNANLGLGANQAAQGGADSALRLGMAPGEAGPNMMDLAQMQQQGWPENHIQMINKFKPILNSWRTTVIRQQMANQHGGQLAGGQLMNPQGPQQPGQLPQQHPNDPRSSSGGGSLPPTIQQAGIQGIPGPVKLPFPTEITQRARLVIESLVREIEQTRAGQYQRREVPEVQRVQMNQAVVGAHPLAVEFERTASLHYMLFNNQQQTRQYLEQAALLREQHRILQSGQQHYIMSLEEVVMAQQSLRIAIHTLKTAYAQKVKQHQEQVAASYRGDGQLSHQQLQQQHQQLLQQQQQQQQQALAMQLGNVNAAGLGSQPPALVQQRPPSQPQYGSPKPDPSKPPVNLGQPSKPAPAPAKPQRNPVASGQPVNTPSPAAATPSNMESAPTPSSANEPATPKSPRGGKAKLPAKRTPSQPQKPKKNMKLPMPPPLAFDLAQPHTNKRQREDELPIGAESVVPVAGPSSPKRVKTEPESTEPIKIEHHTDDPIASMNDAFGQLQQVAPGPNGDGIDPDVLAQLTEFLEGPGAGPSGSSQAQLGDSFPDSVPKAEDVFDFSYYLNDTVGEDDPLGGAGVDVLEADTPDLNNNKETPDSAADDIEHLGQKSPGKGEAPIGDAKAGDRAPTLTEGFWEAFNDGEMSEGAYFMGGGANGFNWSGPIDANATSWIGITGTAA